MFHKVIKYEDKSGTHAIFRDPFTNVQLEIETIYREYYYYDHPFVTNEEYVVRDEDGHVLNYEYDISQFYTFNNPRIFLM